MTPLAWDDNRSRIVEAIELAKRDNVDLLCLPELCITGYGCEDAFHAPSVHEYAWQSLEAIVPVTEGIAVTVGLPVLFQHGIFNTACLMANKKILGFVAKQNLAGDGIHYEPRWFKPWSPGLATILKRGEVEYPLGDIYFDLGGVKVGFEICEDAWVAKRPGAELAARGIDVILNPSASHFGFGRREVRERFVLEGSRAFGCAYVYANLVGCEAGRVIYDGDRLIAAGGELVAVGERCTFQQVSLTAATVDIERIRMNQARTASFRPSLGPDPRCIDASRHAFGTHAAPARGTQRAQIAWEQSSHLKCEEFTRAVTLGLFDYLRKSRSHGFVVSLSGGADSSAVSCLVALAVHASVRELGLSEVLARLHYIPEINTTRSAEDLVHRLLACVYQGTENNSSITRTAAREVAEAINAEYHEIEIDQLVDSYVGLISTVVGRPLTWETDDMALQNVQARVRSPGIWLLANHRRSLLLTTSNRSEAAVGYATMDGDTSGGLNPIGGIDKAFLREWLQWLQTSGPVGLFQIPALKAVTQQAPTAELRPLAAKQTDEADLMPYIVLDQIERFAIRDKKSPLEVFRLTLPLYREQYGAEQLRKWVERFFRLWSINQWKRERYAPSFHLDDENLDPKTWCRFPILSGSYEKELKELAKEGALL